MFNRLKSLAKFLSSNYQSVHLDYKVTVKPRFVNGNRTFDLLYSIIDKQRAAYKDTLTSFLTYTETFHIIKQLAKETNDDAPSWNNGFLPGLDIIGIYGIVAKYKPHAYIEIGSGNSTKVVRKVINELQLPTKVTSIDPYPRANIDHLAHTVIRKPFENLAENQSIIESLNENDILFIDNSHRVFPNSDAMISLLELLPFLNKGVIVHIHDIYLPYDYPQFMCDRFYNEQYLLAALIIGNPQRYKTILPNFFISEEPELNQILTPIWNHPNLANVEQHGGSFWLQIQ
jgi:hypothetical protein